MTLITVPLLTAPYIIHQRLPPDDSFEVSLLQAACPGLPPGACLARPGPHCWLIQWYSDTGYYDTVSPLLRRPKRHFAQIISCWRPTGNRLIAGTRLPLCRIIFCTSGSSRDIIAVTAMTSKMTIIFVYFVSFQEHHLLIQLFTYISEIRWTYNQVPILLQGCLPMLKRWLFRGGNTHDDQWWKAFRFHHVFLPY